MRTSSRSPPSPSRGWWSRSWSEAPGPNRKSRITAAKVSVILLFPALLIAGYAGTRLLGPRLGLTGPCASLAHFYDADGEWLDRGLDPVYGPICWLAPNGLLHRS